MSLGFYDLLAISAGLQVNAGSPSSAVGGHSFRGAGRWRYYSDLCAIYQVLLRRAAAVKRRKETSSPSSAITSLIGRAGDLERLDRQVAHFRAVTSNSMSSILLAEI